MFGCVGWEPFVDFRRFPEEVADAVHHPVFDFRLLFLVADAAESAWEDACSEKVQHQGDVGDRLPGVEHHEHEFGIHESPEEGEEFHVVRYGVYDCQHQFQALRAVHFSNED